MQGLRDRDVFRFCAIPQIMAIGTLALCYNNGEVFHGVVKMRRGLTACVFDECDGMTDLLSWFMSFLQQLQEKALIEVPKSDPTRDDLLELVSSNLQQCEQELQRLKQDQPRKVPMQQRVVDLLLLLFAGIWFHSIWELGQPLVYKTNGSSTGFSAGLLPAEYIGLEKALAFVLLLTAMSRVIFVKVV
eukprot:GHRR01012635.1.p1 GENE.GHRR01012635.1~~GHRR01012635.1.p1  ORF type:complete len:188 (+),score=74.24 GHRR01012635.1:336-899(+)